MKLRVIGSNLLIKQEVIKTTTASGIFVGNPNGDRLPYGVVVSAGERVMDVKVGDRVMFKSFVAGIEDIEFEDEAFMIMPEGAVIAIMPKSE